MNKKVYAIFFLANLTGNNIINAEKNVINEKEIITT